MKGGEEHESLLKLTLPSLLFHFDFVNKTSSPVSESKYIFFCRFI